MKKIQIKRVFLVSENHERNIIVNEDFLGSLSDQVILDALYTAGKDIWIGNQMYHITQQNGQIRHLRYEVVPITQYIPSWYNLIIQRLAGIR